MKKMIQIGWVLWFVAFLWSISPIKIPAYPFGGELDRHKVLVRWIAITGPSFEVLEGSTNLRRQIEILQGTSNTMSYSDEFLILEGDVPWYYLEPAYAYQTNWILEGRIVGFSSGYEDLGFGKVPIFHVIACRPTNYVANFFHRPGYIAGGVCLFVFFAPLVLGLVNAFWLVWGKWFNREVTFKV